MIKIAIIGIAGKMGREIADALKQDLVNPILLTAATEAPGNKCLGQDVLDGLGWEKNNNPVIIADDLEKVINDCDVVIDFTSPDCTMKNIEIVKKHNKKIVIGTTALNEEQKLKIKELGETNACVFAPNMSIGINTLLKVIGDVTNLLGDDFDIELVEEHHRFKKDAPSGTALILAEKIAEAAGRDLKEDAVYGRHGIAERTKKEIGIHTVRGGATVGEHTIIFNSLGEKIEIKHQAHSRKVFAMGAVRAAMFLGDKDKGLFNMIDVISGTVLK